MMRRHQVLSLVLAVNAALLGAQWWLRGERQPSAPAAARVPPTAATPPPTASAAVPSPTAAARPTEAVAAYSVPKTPLVLRPKPKPKRPVFNISLPPVSANVGKARVPGGLGVPGSFQRSLEQQAPYGLEGKSGVPATHVPDPAPDFTCTTLDGDRFHLAEEVASAQVLLCFVKAECLRPVRSVYSPLTKTVHREGPPRVECEMSQRILACYDQLETMYAKPSKRLRVLLVMQGTRASAQEAAHSLHLHSPIAVDDLKRTLGRSYGLISSPTLVLVGPEREVEQVLPAWDRSQVEALTSKIASLTQQPYTPVTHAGDGLPAAHSGCGVE